jgi:hypothetical protein
MAKTETVTGQVIDLVCYTANKSNTGTDHTMGRECALACIKWEGQPVGLLTADGKLYQFAGPIGADNNAKLVPHIAHKVTVTGDVTEKDGMTMLSASELTMVSK